MEEFKRGIAIAWLLVSMTSIDAGKPSRNHDIPFDALYAPDGLSPDRLSKVMFLPGDMCFGKPDHLHHCLFECLCVGSTVCDEKTGACSAGCIEDDPPLDVPGPLTSGYGCQYGNAALYSHVYFHSLRGTNSLVSGIDPTVNGLIDINGPGRDFLYMWLVELSRFYVVDYVRVYRHSTIATAFDVTVGNDTDVVRGLQTYVCGQGFFNASSATDQPLSVTVPCPFPTIGHVVALYSCHFTECHSFDIVEVVVMGYRYLGCPDGYKTTPACSEKCDDGTYGFWCSVRCNCEDPDEACDKQTGSCKSGCKRGFYGRSCQQNEPPCPPGIKLSPGCLEPCDDKTYGGWCVGKCNCFDSEEVCDKKTGACFKSGCQRAFSGVDCQIRALPGTSDYLKYGGYGNLAYGRPTWQSSNYPDDPEPLVSSSLAVDGNLDPEFYSHTSQSAASWWSVYLEYRSAVDVIDIYNVDNDNYTRLSHFWTCVGNKTLRGWKRTRCIYTEGPVPSGGKVSVYFNFTVVDFVNISLTDESFGSKERNVSDENYEKDVDQHLALVEVVVNGYFVKENCWGTYYPESGACEFECKDLNTWGPDCLKRCYCYDDMPCNTRTGVCAFGCAERWGGDTCNSVIKEGRDHHCFEDITFLSCQFDCHCSEGAQCDKYTGECSSGQCATIASNAVNVQWGGPACQIGNLAFGKWAFQSSNRRDFDLDHVTALWAVDGKAFVQYQITSTANEPFSWWMVDLGYVAVIVNVTVYNIHRFVVSEQELIDNREKCRNLTEYREYQKNHGHRRLADFNVMVGNTSDINTHIVCDTHKLHIEPDGYNNKSLCAKNMIARYVAIQLTEIKLGRLNLDILQMSEVTVMGYRYEVFRGFQISPGSLLPCPDGTFGGWCASRCNCADENEVCDKKFGKCEHSGCKSGFGGLGCIHELPDMPAN